VALLFYLWLFPSILQEAKVIEFTWILKVIIFNLVVEFTTFGFWHWFTYVKYYSSLSKLKFNAENPYDKGSNLSREIFFTTLGILQSSAFHCFMMYLWANDLIPYQKTFWDYPIYNIASLLLGTYWREFHFYWCHRMIHPWWKREYGLAQGDIGAFLYRHFHSLHHKSYNPGPFSGLSMHPVEHFIYYTCTLLPLLFSFHPLHFLYVKFHADIAPIGGHDGIASPGGDSDFHWLHHAKFECNYGAPLVDFDFLFGTKLVYKDYLKNKEN